MNENKSIAIKKDGLASLAVFGNKKEEGTREEFKIHFLHDDVGKGIMAFPHIHIIGIKKNGILRIKNHEANCRRYQINRLGRGIRPTYEGGSLTIQPSRFKPSSSFRDNCPLMTQHICLLA